MKRPLTIAAIGLAVVVIAIALNSLYGSRSSRPLPAPQVAELADGQAVQVDALTGTSNEESAAAEAIAALPPFAVEEAAVAAAPAFDLVRIAPDGDAVIAGVAEPGSRVVIRDRTAALGETMADARGEWVFVPDKPLQPGEHWLGLETAAGDGGRAQSRDLMLVVVPEPGEDIAGREAAPRTQALAMTVPRSGVGTAAVLQKPTAAAAPLALSIDSVDRDALGQVAVSGSGTEGALINLYLHNKLIGQTAVGEDGRWTVRPAALPQGDSVLRADHVDSSGSVIARVAVPLGQPGGTAVAGKSGTEASAAPVASAISAPDTGAQSAVDPGLIVIRPGNNLWRIARDTYGAGDAYTVIYEANRNRIKNPNLIYPGQVFTLPESEKP